MNLNHKQSHSDDERDVDDAETGLISPTETKVIVNKVVEHEAPASTQAFWLLIWMAK